MDSSPNSSAVGLTVDSELSKKPLRPQASKTADLSGNITISPHQQQEQQTSEIPHAIMRIYRATRERTGKRDIELITSTLALAQVERLTTHDPEQPAPSSILAFVYDSPRSITAGS